jgi:3D (Asp-Asp-Asp) domain-containing protein
VESNQKTKVNAKELIPEPVTKKFSMIKEKDIFSNDSYQKLFFQLKQPRDFRLSDDMHKEAQFIATAYDLSYESCGKYPDHPAYGITSSGKKATKGRTIAVDPKIIPIGSKVHIELKDQYSYLNGWYVAEDTGILVKGYIIDIFFGKSAFYDMEKFGSRKVDVEIIYPPFQMP